MELHSPESRSEVRQGNIVFSWQAKTTEMYIPFNRAAQLGNRGV